MTPTETVDPQWLIQIEQQADKHFHAKENKAALLLCDYLLWQQPDHLKALLHRGLLLNSLGDMAASVSAFEHAAQIKPDFFEAHANLGWTLWRRGRFEQALQHAQIALSLRPDSVDALRIFGDAALQVGNLPLAQQALRHALKIDPSCAKAGRDLAHALLLDGQYEEGWLVNEYRWEGSDNMHRPVFYKPETEWSPSPALEHAIRGMDLVVYQEQGYGDVIQFSRYIKLLQRDGANIKFWLNEDLVPLIRCMGDDITFIGPNSETTMHAHVALMNLPKIYQTGAHNIPAAPAYLSGRPEQIDQWRECLSPWSGRLKVGVVWCGRPSHDNDFNRSFKLAQFAPILNSQSVQCFSLQKFVPEAKNDFSQAHGSVIDLTAHWKDFSDCAAMVQNLDLVISIDSAMAHLSASVGTPTWIMLPPNPDWRWLQQGESSAWYPSIRLWRRSFAQSKEDQIAQVTQALQTIALPQER